MNLICSFRCSQLLLMDNSSLVAFSAVFSEIHNHELENPAGGALDSRGLRIGHVAILPLVDGGDVLIHTFQF